MKTQVLKGSEQEIAESLVRISGEVREAIVFVEEPVPAAPGMRTQDAQDIFQLVPKLPLGNAMPRSSASRP